MADIKIAGLTKYFGDTLGVEGVSLTISDGELLVLLGPTGSGKSTIVRLLAGLEEPTEGDIWIGGQPVKNVAPKDRHVGLVFPNYALTPQASVFENIAITLKLQRTSPEETNKRVETMAEMLGLSALLERSALDLSVAQSYLVALARAFVGQPQLLLMDGPLMNLERQARASALEQLVTLQRELGITTVYTAEDQAEARQIADRLAVLRAGRIQQVGTAQELYDRPTNRFVATFLGRPRMNLLAVTVMAGEERMQLDIGPTTIRLPDKFREALDSYAGEPVVLGIRPEDVFDKRAAPPKPAISQQSVPVDVQEASELNSRYLLLLNTGQDTLTAISAASSVPTVGTSIEVVFDMDKIHLFDEDTGKRIA